MCKGKNPPHFELDVSQTLQAFWVLPAVSNVDVGTDRHAVLPLPPREPQSSIEGEDFGGEDTAVPKGEDAVLRQSKDSVWGTFGYK